MHSKCSKRRQVATALHAAGGRSSMQSPVTRLAATVVGCYTFTGISFSALFPSARVVPVIVSVDLVGEWLSLVEHLVRDQGVGGSNPLSPTNYLEGDRRVRKPVAPAASLFPPSGGGLCPILWPPRRPMPASTGFSKHRCLADIATEL